VAEMLILKRIDLEGYISAINDDFFIAFIVTLLCVVPVLFLRTKKG
jgi:DHA2 family multidrug resistance protein